MLASKVCFSQFCVYVFVCVHSVCILRVACLLVHAGGISAPAVSCCHPSSTSAISLSMASCCFHRHSLSCVFTHIYCSVSRGLQMSHFSFVLLCAETGHISSPHTTHIAHIAWHGSDGQPTVCMQAWHLSLLFQGWVVTGGWVFNASVSQYCWVQRSPWLAGTVW